MPTMQDVAGNASAHLNTVKGEFDWSLPFPKQLTLFKEAVTAFKVVGYAALLDEGNIQKFFVNMLSISRNWLKLMQAGNADPAAPKVPASEMSALYCALICGDDDLLRNICEQSSRKKISPEYDDEFLVALFVQELILKEVFGQNISTDLEKVLQDIEDYLEEEPAIAVFLRCLLEKNKDEIEDAFLAWHEENVDAINQKADASSARYTMQVTRYIALDGLGLAKLAEKLGYKLPSDMALIPSIARVPLPLNYANQIEMIG
ncbi:hypothetical protein BTA51_22940 [Hahella sp. CCB-MM4]|uniref:Imm49 family immunity protein n=1 Tax=Hahella sp. (strain CCB-MM4) TaxID=1926491 RepID=UPI000B9AFF4F|nr:Imm49 family immunity protein [Hahella sp. CCB-MM4]OZG70966.1 hypothetical protein BTA51_22940 [Hahella sp. CCB-MM4]